MISKTVLAALEKLSRPLLTAYINTQSTKPSAHGRSAGNLVWLKQSAKQLIGQIPPRDYKSFSEQVSRMVKLLGERKPKEMALIILAGATTWEVVPLQLRVEPELHWGKPSLTQLQWILRENKHHCVVVIDHKGVRIFDYGFGEMRQVAEQMFEIDTSQWKKKDLGHVTSEGVVKTRGSQRDTYEHRMAAQYQRFYRQAAVRVSRLFKANNCCGVFLVGSEEMTKPIQQGLPDAVRAHSSLIKRDLGKLSVTELQRALACEIGDWEREEESKMVTRILEDDRKAVRGTDETLAQLEKGKLRTVVLARPLKGSVHECIECGWIDRSADMVCPVCGRERRDVELREVLMDTARMTATEIEVVSGAAAEKLNQSGGMAGWLRGRTQAELR
jgi:rubrerythrin